MGLIVALAENSLTLLSDGFHNLSDVLALIIAAWASKASRRGSSDQMSYGWARTEILGALTNGVFLLSLCLYTSLEAVPEMVEAITGTSADEPAGLYFIVVAAGGLAVNTFGTVVFAITGQSYGHSHAGGGHGHSHGGHGHAHEGHGHDDEHTPLTDVHEYDDHGHSHSHGHD